MEQGRSLLALAELFRKFPSIGQRQAERFARFISRSDPRYVQQLLKGIAELQNASKQCPECFIRHESSDNTCDICLRNDTDTLIVVEKDVDVYALEASMDRTLRARYFILGTLIPIADSKTTHVRVPRLISVIQKKQLTEIIIALSVHPDADHTMQYLANHLRKQFPATQITALGRGLSSGSELEYSDPETLINAFKHRG